MLEWSEAYATGVRLVDIQHRMLIEKINEMERLLGASAPTKATCDDLLKFLGSYIVSHFKFEERCMHEAQCPAHQKNQQAHQAFLRAFAGFKQRYEVQGPTPDLLKEFHAAAVNWIRDHILTLDIQLRSCATKSLGEDAE